jgi:hypothetical protein
MGAEPPCLAEVHRLDTLATEGRSDGWTWARLPCSDDELDDLVDSCTSSRLGHLGLPSMRTCLMRMRRRIGCVDRELYRLVENSRLLACTAALIDLMQPHLACLGYPLAALEPAGLYRLDCVRQGALGASSDQSSLPFVQLTPTDRVCRSVRLVALTLFQLFSKPGAAHLQEETFITASSARLHTFCSHIPRHCSKSLSPPPTPASASAKMFKWAQKQ